jgi:hypothetical protein
MNYQLDYTPVAPDTVFPTVMVRRRDGEWEECRMSNSYIAVGGAITFPPPQQ